MLVLSGAAIVLPDRVLPAGTLVLDGTRIADVRAGAAAGGEEGTALLHGHLIVPAFIDGHTHGLDGIDTLDGDGAVARIAAQLPRHGVAAFAPTAVACSPDVLARFLDDVRAARAAALPQSARVLPAHLESNFINPDFAGAQPVRCLRQPREALDRLRLDGGGAVRPGGADFDGAEILRVIAACAPDVGTITLAPELPGGLELIPWLVAGGHRVSLGHSASTYDQAMAAVAAGARQATHLFNRMPPLDHRRPGLAGAALQAAEVAVEIIGDGVHVHPAMVRLAVAAKGASRVLAISDGTAAAGLPAGATARLGQQEIRVSAADGQEAEAARLGDGTLAGSTAAMDRVFRVLVERVGLSLVEAATVCATTPARELGLVGHGVIAAGAVADLVVLDAELRVVQTYIGGQLAYTGRAGHGGERGGAAIPTLRG